VRLSVVFGVTSALLLAASAGPRAAPNLNATWLVTNVHGSVTAQRGADTAVPVNTGDRIVAGTRVRSQARGHVTLMRDGDVVQVDAESAVELAMTDWGTPAKGVIQTFGTATFKVTSEPTKPFKVRTPFLTATAVGTAFTVTVGHDSADVKVLKGAVEVWSVLSGETNLLVAGEIAHASIREMMEAREAEAALVARSAAPATGAPVGAAARLEAALPAAQAPQTAEVPAGFEDAPVLPEDVAPRPAAKPSNNEKAE
jgi:ferric-dicitrate binding protein FerR (iron transport regulator)